ncbi:MAG: radical SAM protein [Chloroflexota bacterium]|nr:radical SAM protein [Chloroflexota bacterium]
MDSSSVQPLIALNNVPIPAHRWKLWIYTNYDCNLRCSYCVAKSSPNAPRRSIGLENVRRLVDEAVELGIGHIFFTGGEPFLLHDIYDMLAYASARVETTVLTNAMLFQSNRLEKLKAIASDRLEIQVSLDGGRAEDHDAYRGKGTWEKTVVGIRALQAEGFRVRLSTTETPANSPHMDALTAFRDSLGIPAEHHFIRPLAKRGYSKEGMELGMDNLSPELTVNIDGVFWHPLSTDADMQVAKHFLPLKPAMDTVQTAIDEMQRTGTMGRISFTCG